MWRKLWSGEPAVLYALVCDVSTLQLTDQGMVLEVFQISYEGISYYLLNKIQTLLNDPNHPNLE